MSVSDTNTYMHFFRDFDATDHYNDKDQYFSRSNLSLNIKLKILKKQKHQLTK